jgi:hypothetical protein
MPEIAGERPALGLTLRSGLRPPFRANPNAETYTTTGNITLRGLPTS